MIIYPGLIPLCQLIVDVLRPLYLCAGILRRGYCPIMKAVLTHKRGEEHLFMPLRDVSQITNRITHEADLNDAKLRHRLTRMAYSITIVHI